MKRSFWTGAAIAATAMVAATAAQAQDPYVRLSNSYLGGGQSLDLGNRVNASILTGEMAATGPAWGQFWNFVPQPDGSFRMMNRFAPGQCLDVSGDGVTYMDACGAQIGQRWRVSGTNGNVAIHNDFRPGQCLDVTNDPGLHIAMMAPCGPQSGQRWSVTSTGVWP